MSIPNVIEFIGMPGSGKTTAATGLASLLRNQGANVLMEADGSEPPGELITMPRYRRNIERVRMAASIPRLALSAALRSTSRARAAEMSRLITREWRRRRLHHTPNDLIILDEGSLHKLCIVFAEGEVADPLNLLSTLMPPSLCIVLRIEVELAAERVRGRPPMSPVESKLEGELIRYLSQYRECEDALIERLPCPVILLDSSRDDVIERAAEAAADHLSKRE